MKTSVNAKMCVDGFGDCNAKTSSSQGNFPPVHSRGLRIAVERCEIAPSLGIPRRESNQRRVIATSSRYRCTSWTHSHKLTCAHYLPWKCSGNAFGSFTSFHSFSAHRVAQKPKFRECCRRSSSASYLWFWSGQNGATVSLRGARRANQ